MGRSFTPALQVLRKVLHSDQGWLLFVRIELADGKQVRLVRDTVHRQLGGENQWWQACSLSLDSLDEEVGGAAPRMSVTVPNVSRLPLTMLELTGEPLGRKMSVILAHETETQDPWPAISSQRTWTMRIATAGVDALACTLESASNAGLRDVPGPVFSRERFGALIAG